TRTRVAPSTPADQRTRAECAMPFCRSAEVIIATRAARRERLTAGSEAPPGSSLRARRLRVALPDRDLHQEPVFQLRVDRDSVGDRRLLRLPGRTGAGHEGCDALARARGARTQPHLGHALALVAPKRAEARRRSRERLAVSLERPRG